MNVWLLVVVAAHMGFGTVAHALGCEGYGVLWVDGIGAQVYDHHGRTEMWCIVRNKGVYFGVCRPPPLGRQAGVAIRTPSLFFLLWQTL